MDRYSLITYVDTTHRQVVSQVTYTLVTLGDRAATSAIEADRGSRGSRATLVVLVARVADCSRASSFCKVHGFMVLRMVFLRATAVAAIAEVARLEPNRRQSRAFAPFVGQFSKLTCMHVFWGPVAGECRDWPSVARVADRSRGIRASRRPLSQDSWESPTVIGEVARP